MYNPIGKVIMKFPDDSDIQEFEGIVQEVRTSNMRGTVYHTFIIVEYEGMKFDELNMEDKNMGVKIRKEPVEISLEELKRGEEYEKVILHINKEKIERFENTYGRVSEFSSLPDCVRLSDGEIEFKENYLTTDDYDYDYTIPYEFIEKIEVIK